jgi:galactitol-specific phosphotransferase system IIB component
MTRKVKGKKNFQTIDGVKFLQEWRKRVHKVDAELGIENPRFGATASSASELETGKDKTKTSNRTRAKATLLAERKQREKSLTGNRKDATANKIVLPFGLKRALVEQWEIITQCGNLTALPASVTIRQALNEYLRSKGVDPVVSHCAARLVVEESAVADFQATPIDGSAEIKTSIRMISETTESKTREDYIGQGNEVETPENSNALQGWREMADGIAQFFDEALPHRLLYREEYAQLQVLERLPQLDNKPYSEIYGCEYLLRLFTRLPVILTNDLPPEDSRAVFAKLNDLVRFLYKNQSTLFAAHHRKPIKDEHLEAARIESKQLKKKRREEPAQGHIDKKRKLKEGKKS